MLFSQLFLQNLLKNVVQLIISNFFIHEIYENTTRHLASRFGKSQDFVCFKVRFCMFQGIVKSLAFCYLCFFQMPQLIWACYSSIRAYCYSRTHIHPHVRSGCFKLKLKNKSPAKKQVPSKFPSKNLTYCLGHH